MFPSDPSSAEMDKAKSVLRFCVLLILFSGLSEQWGERVERLFRTPITPRTLQMLWNYSRPTLIAAAGMIILGVLTVIAFFRMLRALARRGGGTAGRTAARTSAEKRAARTAAGSAASGSRASARGAVRQHAEEDAIHCDHLIGRQKYLEQIEGYLRTGLIDRSEYRVLKERYMSLDIPDDYH